MDAEPGQQPTTYKGAQDTDDQIADDPESGPAYDLTGQPACNETYEQYDQEAFARHIHLATSIVGPNGVHQRNQVLRQSVMLACQSDPQPSTYFLADRGATHSVDLNCIASFWTDHQGLPFATSASCLPSGAP
jgi:hypothetical protein